MRHKIFIIAIGLLLSIPPVSAQSAEPFSTLELLVAGAANVGVGELDEFWRARHGGLFRIAAPFYIGTAAVALHQTGFEANPPEQPDFVMRTATAEWNLTARLPARVRGFAGIHAGATAMKLLESRHLTNNVDENEFVAGLQLGISVPVARSFGATLIASRRRVFTRHPLRLTFLAVGVHYSLPTPPLLREVLE